MDITAALAADLAMLTEALDEPGVDVAQMLARLAADAKVAVSSYRGLTVIVEHAAYPLILTAMEDSADQRDALSSLMMSLPHSGPDGAGPLPVVILYAGTPGAFVDLAADLSWLTGLGLGNFVLDRHLHRTDEPADDRSVQTASVVDQAIGVLLGRGYTPEQAVLELDARAVDAGKNRADTARVILSNLPTTDPDQAPDAG